MAFGSLSAKAEEAEENKAKVEALVKSLEKTIDANADASDKFKAFAKEKLLPLCTNAVLIKAVQEQNAKKMTLDDIKKTDKEWSEAEDELPIQKELLNNECAKTLTAFVKENDAVVEGFVMDNQGANVGQNALTSDYWQGDEDKWKNSYNEGKGGVDVGKVKFDKSANTQLQQISLPIINEKGEVIGAVTYGLDTAKL
jgi:hypothetical protein